MLPVKNTAKIRKVPFSGDSASGFTMIELLIVIVLIATLAGISLMVINPQRQKDTALDGVRQANMSKLAEVTEAYFAVEGLYPTTADVSNPSSAFMTSYVKNWPTQGGPYNYGTFSNGFRIYVVNSFGNCYKYSSAWGELRHCSTDCNVSNDSCTLVP